MREKQWIPPVSAAHPLHPLLSKKRTCMHSCNYHEVFSTVFANEKIII